MQTIIDAESTLTDRYQTTVPEVVRQALNLGKRDKIHYEIKPDGKVVLSRLADTAEQDPVVNKLLEHLAGDIADHPERLQALSPSLMNHLQSLAGHVQIDLDAPLADDDE